MCHLIVFPSGQFKAKTKLNKISISYDYLIVALILKRLGVKANHFFTTTGWQLLPWHSKMALFISLSSHPSKVSTCVIVPRRPHLSPWACLSTFPTCDYDPPRWALVAPPCSKITDICLSGMKLGTMWNIPLLENVTAHTV